MVHYKLTYFDARGLAEATRQVFHLAGVPFENVRLVFGQPEWNELKPTTPFGTLPLLSVDGFVIAQSAAILRYVGRKYGYAGKTPEEEAWVDAIVDLFKDFMSAFLQFIRATHAKKSAEELDQIKKEVVAPAREAYFNSIVKLLEKSTSGFLVGDSLTFADLVIADNLETLERNGFLVRQEYPKLVEFKKRIQNLPELKEYIATRPDTKF